MPKGASREAKNKMFELFALHDCKCVESVQKSNQKNYFHCKSNRGLCMKISHCFQCTSVDIISSSCNPLESAVVWSLIQMVEHSEPPPPLHEIAQSMVASKYLAKVAHVHIHGH